MTEENEVQPNITLQQSPSGAVYLRSLDPEHAWNLAKDVVDYPAGIVDGYWQDEDGNFFDATGMTRDGRDKAFRFVIVDPYRIGAFQTIACVSDTYGTLNTRQIYEELHSDLENMDITVYPFEVYVSPNGGQQMLVLEVENLSTWDGPDRMSMQIVLITSVDGSTRHAIKAVPFNKETRAPMSIYGHAYNLAARHTTTIKERSINMIPSITSLVGKWDSDIIPMMSLLCEEEFDQNEALAIADELADEIGLAEKHKERVTNLYPTQHMATNETRHNMYRVVSAICQTINDVGQEKRQWLNRHTEKMEKAMHRRIKNNIKRNK